ncbi:MAG: hypothetical protein U0324_43890 [Polyangiales bacterium]
MTFTNYDFGPEFYNLASSREPPGGGAPTPYLSVDVERETTGLPRPWSARSAVADLNAFTLQFLANDLFEAGGGYLYFPPGRYLVGRGQVRPSAAIDVGEFADIVIPENVTLWFAPGATLIPISYFGNAGRRREIPGLAADSPEHWKTRIEIRGDIVADLRSIFDVFANRDDAAQPAGRILLTSQRIREVYPEWWGAFPQDPGGSVEAAVTIQRTTLALQAAIEAAYVWRTTPVRTPTGALQTPREWHRRPAIPVVAKGTYLLDDTIHVTNPVDSSLWPADMPAVDAGGFDLRGDHEPSSPGQGAPSLVASGYAVARFRGTSLLWLDGVLGFSVRGVNFSGKHWAPRCVTVTPTHARFSYSEFDSCSFLEPAAVGVYLDAGTVPEGAPVRDYWNQLFTRCRFDQGTVTALDTLIGVEDRTPRIPDREGNLVAAELRLEDNEGLEFRTSTFFGHASPAIRAYSGRFAVNEGNFHVLRAKHPRLAALSPDKDPRLAPNFRHGTDIYIEHDDRQASGRRWRVVPAAFTAREVESQSWQFLATMVTLQPPGLPAGNRSSVILLNMHHAAVWNRDASDPAENHGVGAPTPPGIFWGDPGVQGSHLIMVGCQFYGQYVRYRSAPGGLEVDFVERSVVYVAAGVRGDIYNVGAHTTGAYANNPPPMVTPNTQDYLIRVYDPSEWHRVPDARVVEAVPRIDLTQIRQLVPQRARTA